MRIRSHEISSGTYQWKQAQKKRWADNQKGGKRTKPRTLEHSWRKSEWRETEERKTTARKLHNRTNAERGGDPEVQLETVNNLKLYLYFTFIFILCGGENLQRDKRFFRISNK